jgi:hypothetical protein
MGNVDENRCAGWAGDTTTAKRMYSSNCVAFKYSNIIKMYIVDVLNVRLVCFCLKKELAIDVAIELIPTYYSSCKYVVLISLRSRKSMLNIYHIHISYCDLNKIAFI